MLFSRVYLNLQLIEFSLSKASTHISAILASVHCVSLFVLGLTFKKSITWLSVIHNHHILHSVGGHQNSVFLPELN